jgi:hypothetical protein
MASKKIMFRKINISIMLHECQADFRERRFELALDLLYPSPGGTSRFVWNLRKTSWKLGGHPERGEMEQEIGIAKGGHGKRLGCALELILVALMFGLLITGGPLQARADTLTLADANATATIDAHDQRGMFEWTVDGVTHLFQQWFWYRVGSGGPESSLDTLSLAVHSRSDTNFDFDYETLFLRYLGSGFKVEVTYMLTGGTSGSGASDVAETIKIVNTSGSSLDFHFFQYTDFNLNGTPEGDTAERTNTNTIHQTEGATVFGETIGTPAASHYQVGLFPAIRNALNDGAPTTLSDFAGPLTGDVSFAWQWDMSIPAGGTFLISKDKLIGVPLSPGSMIEPAPEPGTLILLGMGILWATCYGTLLGRRR